MLLTLDMPQVGELMEEGELVRVLVAPGDRVEPGTRFAEVMVDLSAFAEQNCPPISFFCIVARERGWVRALNTAAGQRKEVGAALALLTTSPDEPIDGIATSRGFRASVAGVLLAPIASGRTA